MILPRSCCNSILSWKMPIQYIWDRDHAAVFQESSDACGSGADACRRLRQRPSQRQFLKCGLFHHSGHDRHRHQLHRVQCDQRARLIGSSVYGHTRQRPPGRGHLVGLWRRLGERAGKHQRQRPVHAAQLPDRRPRRGGSNRDASCKSQPPRLLRADRDAGIPATAHAGERGSGRQWQRHHHRLSGRGGRRRPASTSSWQTRQPGKSAGKAR